MKYLKKFSIINEKSDEKCDFDTFKDIMLELTDVYTDVVFSQPEEYYQCQFKLYDSDDLDFDLPRIDLNSVVGYIDSPDHIEYSLDNDVVYKRVDDYINNLEDFKNNIDNIIEKYSKIKEVFKNIEDYILPRFKHFDNFQACSVGFNELEGIFIITFDTDEYEN